MSGGRVNVRVVVRFRPLNSLEKEMDKDGKMVAVLAGSESLRFIAGKDNKSRSGIVSNNNSNNNSNSGNNAFADDVESEGKVWCFDRVFDTDTTQPNFFEYVGKPAVDDFLKGLNCTIFAYGQTGSGKTFSTFGDRGSNASWTTSANGGVVPRALTAIFQRIEALDHVEAVEMAVSFLELYCEEMTDLLADSPKTLKIREPTGGEMYVENLSEQDVLSPDEAMHLLLDGEKRRHTAATRMNQESSRSHCVFTLSMSQLMRDGSKLSSKLHFVDLAGSEIVKKTMAEGQRFEEAKSINLSLTTLSKVINALTDPNPQHPPFRDSQLTRFLKPALGGNSKTTVIVACSPHRYNYVETLSSLRFAERAKRIQNNTKVNVQLTRSQLEALVDSLKQQLGHMTTLYQTLKDNGVDLEPGTALAAAATSTAIVPAPVPNMGGADDVSGFVSVIQMRDSEIRRLRDRLSRLDVNESDDDDSDTGNAGPGDVVRRFRQATMDADSELEVSTVTSSATTLATSGGGALSNLRAAAGDFGGKTLRRELYEAFVAGVPLFAKLTKHEKAQVAKRLTTESLKRGQRVGGENKIYFVERGALAYRQGSQPEKQLETGNFFGEITLLANVSVDVAGTATVGTAVATIASIDRSTFLEAVGPAVGLLRRECSKMEAYKDASAALVRMFKSPLDMTDAELKIFLSEREIYIPTGADRNQMLRLVLEYKQKEHDAIEERMQAMHADLMKQRQINARLEKEKFQLRYLASSQAVGGSGSGNVAMDERSVGKVKMIRRVGGAGVGAGGVGLIGAATTSSAAMSRTADMESGTLTPRSMKSDEKFQNANPVTAPMSARASSRPFIPTLDLGTQDDSAATTKPAGTFSNARPIESGSLSARMSSARGSLKKLPALGTSGVIQNFPRSTTAGAIKVNLGDVPDKPDGST
eukprot:c7407_g1_i1.p1 GENE.c7407_g1_i1~~c7407_g1_i1.p1  ORF type:complete len:927 (+),score=268.44 c7407_g1_i1:123-2903(+)